jgi:NADH dehydrogenase FAD-containing subunit
VSSSGISTVVVIGTGFGGVTAVASVSFLHPKHARKMRVEVIDKIVV